MLKNSKKKKIFVSLLLISFLVAIDLSVVKASEQITLENAIASYRQGNYKEAVSKFKQIIEATEDREKKAIALSNLAASYYQLGNYDRAITAWEESLTLLNKISNNEEYLIKATLSLAQAYISRGDGRQAISRLLKIAKRTKNPLFLGETWGTLGSIYYSAGANEQAIAAYQKSLEFNPTSTILINLSLAYLSRSNALKKQVEEIGINEFKSLKESSRKDLEKASELALRAVKKSQYEGIRQKIEANINYLKFIESPSQSQNYISETLELIESYSDSSSKALALIELAQLSQSLDLLQKAIEISKKIDDRRTLSTAYLELAKIYLAREDYNQARNINNKGKLAAESTVYSENLFKILRQSGDIELKLGNKSGAFTSYSLALWYLKTNRDRVKNNLLFELQKEVKPFLRNYISLLLESNQPQKAIEVLSTLKLSEFQAYFNDPCLDISLNNLKETNEIDKEVKVYSFITPNTTYILVQKADKISLYPINIKQKEIEQLTLKYQDKLINVYSRNHKKEAQQLYDILIKPIAKDLAASTKITFINDGILRAIPTDIFYDGKQYLFQKYLIDYSSGLNVPDSTQRKVNRTLIAGSSIFQSSDLSPLPGVKNEINFLDRFIGKSLILLDRKFTFEAVKQALANRRYDTIHIATHGFFGGSVNNSYLAAYDRKIDLNQFSGLLFSAVKKPFLLFLNGCQTAVGNSESPLGIAGVGLRARSANIVASLWDVRDDAAAQFTAEFYREYKSGKSIAEARRAAQLKLFQQSNFRHPSFWGAYIHIRL